MNKRKVIIPALMLCALAACKKSTTTEIPIGTVDCATVSYTETIKPLFDANCVSCHNTNSPDGALSNYAETKIYADNGKLKDEVLSSRSMPIGTPLTSTALGQVKCWLDAGAPSN
ncbi:MAG: hypothetical protein GQ574_19105 [Crocinitomix sp.]|nr:hypothetical protein [Crocinitomix sp.]